MRRNHLTLVRCWCLLAGLSTLGIGGAFCSTQAQTWKEALTFHASFDHGLKADFAKGDPQLYTTLKQRPEVEAKQGNHTDGKTVRVAEVGLTGSALRFDARDSRWLFYAAEGNVPFAA